MTSSAPSSRRPSVRRARPVTCAPASLASWIANRPTPPLAPVTSTALADEVAAELERPERGQCRHRERRGLLERDRVGQLRQPIGSDGASSAHAPAGIRPTMRVPAGGPLPSAAGSRTTPATSQPVTVPGSSVSRRRVSPRLRLNALTSTSASWCCGLGSGTSASSAYGGDCFETSARTVAQLICLPA